MFNTHRSLWIGSRLVVVLCVLSLVAGCVPPRATETVMPPAESLSTPPSVAPTIPPQPTSTPKPAAMPTAASLASSAPALAGRWEGKLVLSGMGLEIIANFIDEDGQLSGTLDIPAQGAAGIPLHDIRYEAPSIHFEMLSGKQLGVFEGELLPGGTMEGQFLQSGVQGTFELARPQEQAVGPLPYVEEEVTFGHDDVTLAGMLTLPEGSGPFPAVILLSGSGQQNRDGEIPVVPGYKPFRVIADHLTRSGIAVLRYDDRGVGGSIGDVVNVTTADFADDAEAALDYLRSRTEIDPAQIGLLGHSEGGMIVAMLAARRPDVAFAIPMGGNAVSGYDTVIKQAERLVLASGVSEQEAAETAAAQQAVLDLAVAQDWETLETKIIEIATERIEALPETQKDTLGDLQAVIQQQVAAELQAFQSPWYRFFLTYDPADDWAQITVPVLALFGAKDAQVDAEQNRVALEAALQQAGNDDVTVVLFPTANHLFQDAQTGAFEEYATLAPEFVPDFLDTITEWLLARLK